MDPAKLVKTMIASLALIAVGPNNGTARPPRTPPQTFRFAQPAANAGGCEIYYALQPVDPALLKLLGTPAVPTNSSLLTSPEYIQQRDWDFPSKVTPWSQRPKPEEIALRREQLAGTSAADAAKQKGNAIPNWALWNYGLEPFTQHDWNDLQKWFAKELPKKVPGACLDPQKTDHVMLVGVIVLGSGGSVDSSGARIQYGQTVGQTETTVGPNSGISPAVSAHLASARAGRLRRFFARWSPRPRLLVPRNLSRRCAHKNSRRLLLPLLRRRTPRRDQRHTEIPRHSREKLTAQASATSVFQPLCPLC